MAKRKSTSKPRRKRQLVRPEFKPCWSKDRAIAIADRDLAQDHYSAVAMRVSAVTLSRTPEELIRLAVSGDAPHKKSLAEDAIKLIKDAEKHLMLRLEMLNAAKLRIHATAAYAYGVA